MINPSFTIQAAHDRQQSLMAAADRHRVLAEGRRARRLRPEGAPDEACTSPSRGFAWLGAVLAPMRATFRRGRRSAGARIPAPELVIDLVAVIEHDVVAPTPELAVLD